MREVEAESGHIKSQEQTETEPKNEKSENEK